MRKRKNGKDAHFECRVGIAIVVWNMVLLSVCLVAVLLKNNQHDTKGPGGELVAKVHFVVAQTRFSPGWCRMLVSSLFTNVTVVSVGNGGWYGHVRRWTWIEEYIRRGNMRDEDIVVAFDGADTFFTEVKFREREIQTFLQRSPRNPEAYSETAILQGVMSSPLIFATERGCYAPQAYIMLGDEDKKSDKRCEHMYEKMRQLASEGGAGGLAGSGVKKAYLNGGGAIARVWALKEALKVFFSIKRESYKWWCDQSMWVVVFMWSITRPQHVSQKLLLRRGIMSLDYTSRWFVRAPLKANFSSIIVHSGPNNWEKLGLQRSMRVLSWYRQLATPNGRQQAKEYLRSQMVWLYNPKRKKLSLKRFVEVCPIDKAVNQKWLSRPLRK
ncbi:expression site-associated gene (ESAG) protein, putative [Trypanosoma brucei brucei TREU927]|uniref:Expression site-associated gene (ESAG) protein, putative n=1 Tax=Trypanosoma brucei brucei (strain 927/4 GUTat10.1) TaxID=185431 RepID=Q586J0_TRYB2|nr:expression site-associated gene (ESAG) protein, putative [Trypanosoma brucei brucei TREU927]AAQ15659.1 expression site-associated gene (ESAG) protein, putative [Trypanosoma brucei brucei TREU927]AAX79180.1 expression site-associated gene (ESAG) protein, putative [Trypanosoma brucei]